MRVVSDGAPETGVDPADRVVAQREAMSEWRAGLEALATSEAAISYTPRIGVVDVDPPSPLGRLRLAAFLAEMTRRLLDFDFRTYSLSDSPDVVGESATAGQPLLPWNDQLALRLPTEIDALVVVCSVWGETREPLRRILKDLGGVGLPLYVVVTASAGVPSPTTLSEVFDGGSPPTVVAVDPVAFGDRLFPQDLINDRVDYLRSVGRGPTGDRFALISLTGLPGAEVQPIWSALRAAGRRLDAELFSLVAADDGAPFSAAPEDLEPVDLLSLVKRATVVIAGEPAIVVLAIAMGTPVVVVSLDAYDSPMGQWAKCHGLEVTSAEGLAVATETAVEKPPDSVRPQLVATFEAILDEVADEIASSTQRRLAQSVAKRIAELADQVHVLEEANAGLRQLLIRERSALAAISRPSPDPEAPYSHRHLQRLLEEARKESAQLRFELDALYGTRTMRAVQPARRMYAKLRSIRR